MTRVFPLPHVSKSSATSICVLHYVILTWHKSNYSWPLRESVIFPEFLLSRCQYLRIQDYAHLICYWCDTCQSSWHFLLGQSYLALGENHKALSCFLKAAKGIGKDALVLIICWVIKSYDEVFWVYDSFSLPRSVIGPDNSHHAMLTKRMQN